MVVFPGDNSNDDDSGWNPEDYPDHDEYQPGEL